MPTADESTVVCDSSTLIAALLVAGPTGQWASDSLRGRELAAPALLPFEVSNVLRRHELAGKVSPDQAAQAHQDLIDLPIQLWPYEAVAGRVRELCGNLTAYDAPYVALAEILGCSLITLDARIARAPGINCEVLHP